MLQLTLTPQDRQAIDWIGNRYSHGNKLFKVLVNCMKYDRTNHISSKDIAWNDNIDITFFINGRHAVYIKLIAIECDYRWDCFAPELKTKLNEVVR